MDNNDRNKVLADLQEIYRLERILVKNLKILNENAIALTFIFPPYERTKDNMEHISGLQIHEAVYEGYVCLIEHMRHSSEALRSTYFQTGNIWTEKRALFEINPMISAEHFEYLKKIRPGQSVELTFRTERIKFRRIRRRWISLTIKFNGSQVRGSAEMLIPTGQ